MKTLVSLLLLVVPLVVSLLEKRAKARKEAVLPGGSEPGKRPGVPGQARNDAAAEDMDLPNSPDFPADSRPAQGATATADTSQAEGTRAINRSAKAAEEKPEEKKLEIDKKKLILYSEILKPKFDE
mgnify:CR=1 FL=1